VDLSVVIPCYNGEETLGEQLDALKSQTWGGAWEVVVADNGSTDGSRELVQRYQKHMPELRAVDASARRGQPYALNVGAEHARGEAIVFVDADDVVAPGWIAAIGMSLAVNEFVASCHDVRHLNSDWLVRSRGEAQSDGLQTIWYPPYLPHAGGCGLGVRRYLLEPLVFVPEAIVYIRFRAGMKGLFRQARRWAEYNDLVYKRHRPTDMRIPKPWKKYRRGWRRIARRLPEIGDRHGRYGLLWEVGWQVGLLTGSLKHRVAPAVWVPKRERPEITRRAADTAPGDSAGERRA
jgi:glycosyltransferase involved in cell wall biosynthesis